MDEAIQQLINQLPVNEDHARQLWVSDEDFRDLCHEYTLCQDTLNRWSNEMVPQVQKAEYVSLRQRLEFEIRMRIRDFQSLED
jgi:hypothetical protein